MSRVTVPDMGPLGVPPGRNRGAGKRVISMIIGTLASLLALWLGFCWFAYSYPIYYHPRPFRERGLDRAVAWLQAQRLPKRQTMAVLPPDLASLSVTGRVYITDELIFVPSWIGRETMLADSYSSGDNWIEGYLYSRQPLVIRSDDDRFIDWLNVPWFCSPGQAAQDKGVQDIEMYIAQRLGPHWYSVDSFS